MTAQAASGKVAAQKTATGRKRDMGSGLGSGLDIGFIGLGKMGQPMARRLIEAGHKLVIYDTRSDAAAPLLALGAQLASSPAEVADRVETVMASLPEPHIVAAVATGEGGVIHGKRIKRFVDLSTTGSRAAADIAAGSRRCRQGRARRVRHRVRHRPSAWHGADHETRQ
jgi:glutamyl-tRNA reductase